MQEKVVFDTNIYIGAFNKGLYREEINGFNKVMFLVHPVLHELWMGAKGKAETRHLIKFGSLFIKLGRLVTPTPSTQIIFDEDKWLRTTDLPNPIQVVSATTLGDCIYVVGGCDHIFRPLRQVWYTDVR